MDEPLGFWLLKSSKYTAALCFIRRYEHLWTANSHRFIQACAYDTFWCRNRAMFRNLCDSASTVVKGWIWMMLELEGRIWKISSWHGRKWIPVLTSLALDMPEPTGRLFPAQIELRSASWCQWGIQLPSLLELFQAFATIFGPIWSQ